MPGYINAWRKEHGQICEALSQISRLNIFSEAGQKKLQELKRSLGAHLQSEDLHLYPFLKKAAETDARLKRELFLFAADMDKITGETMAFFRKQENDPKGEDIPAEFGRISALLKSRISREESLLMKEFVEVTAPAANPSGNGF